jgi:hypothetical protein
LLKEVLKKQMVKYIASSFKKLSNFTDTGVIGTGCVGWEKQYVYLSTIRLHERE